MKCKRGTWEDIEEIIELRLRYFRDAYSELDSSMITILKQNMKNYLYEHLDKDCFVYLVERDKKKVACGIVNIFMKVPNKRFPNGRYAEIYGVYTIEEYRRNGYATAIIKSIIDDMSMCDVSYIELDATADGYSIYAKSGFERVDNGYTNMRFHIESRRDV